MFAINTPFAKAKDCVLVQRGSGKNVRYDIISESKGPMAILNLPGYGKSETVVAMRDDAEYSGMLSWAKRMGLIKKVFGVVPSGFIPLYIVELDVNVLKLMK